MHTILLWFDILLIIGGILVSMGGLLWEKSAQLLYYLGVVVDPDLGFKVILAAFIMLLAGVGLIYLIR